MQSDRICQKMQKDVNINQNMTNMQNDVKRKQFPISIVITSAVTYCTVCECQSWCLECWKSGDDTVWATSHGSLTHRSVLYATCTESARTRFRSLYLVYTRPASYSNTRASLGPDLSSHDHCIRLRTDVIKHMHRITQKVA